jgi:sterol desaturase/sphingolipid hydroxylase (fatty acid hydroxylase superfamily)
MLDALPGTLVFLAMMAGLFVPLEAFFPARATTPSRRAMALGAGLLVLNTLLMQWLGVPVLNALGSAVNAEASRGVGVLVLVFVLSDLVGYFIHRAMHRVPLLWRFHKLHHEATELSWLDAWRQHPVDFVLHGLAVGAPGALLGASLSGLASVVVLRKAFTTFLHANLKVSFGLVLASPDFHAVHHSADPRQYDTNFAGTFPVWDVLFGTISLSPPGERVGVRGDEVVVGGPLAGDRPHS